MAGDAGLFLPDSDQEMLAGHIQNRLSDNYL